MPKRMFFSFTGVIWLVLVFHLNEYMVAAVPQCRCLASNATCWPNASTWQNFSMSVDGRLLQPTPSAAVCDGNTYSAVACNITQTQWSNGLWRSDQVGAMQNHNWENSSCSIYFNSTTCNQGAVPVIAVNATLPEHVQATVSFVAANNLRLVVKTTGHDYLGRSGAAGSVLLWLHYMKNMTLISQYSSCNRSTIINAARLGAGVQWGEAYRWLDGFNLTAIGGAAASVGAVGGYLQGGGHGPLSRWKGLAADQVLEYDVVLANGQRQTVSPCQNGDLFWALSGGGGGTYGIVLSAVVRTYPTPYMVAMTFGVSAPNPTRYSQLIRSFVRFLPTAADAGWSGYFTMVDSSLGGIFHVPNGDVGAFSAMTNQFAANNSDLTFVGGDVFVTASFYSYFAGVFANGNPTGFDVLLSSRLIPESLMRTDPNKVADAFVQANGQSSTGSSLLGHLVAGGQVANTSMSNNSVNPGWRTALVHMVNTQAWSDSTTDPIQQYLAQQLTNRGQILNQVSTGSQGSCYLNEADPNEPDWQVTFFGSQGMYNRLKSVKTAVDPDGLFVCKNCVGSDDWTTTFNCPKTSRATQMSSTVFLFFILIIHLFK